jgi:hypothetical protein
MALTVEILPYLCTESVAQCRCKIVAAENLLKPDDITLLHCVCGLRWRDQQDRRCLADTGREMNEGTVPHAHTQPERDGQWFCLRTCQFNRFTESENTRWYHRGSPISRLDSTSISRIQTQGSCQAHYLPQAARWTPTQHIAIMVQPAQLWKKERKNLGMIRENFHLKPFLPDLTWSSQEHTWDRWGGLSNLIWSSLTHQLVPLQSLQVVQSTWSIHLAGSERSLVGIGGWAFPLIEWHCPAEYLVPTAHQTQTASTHSVCPSLHVARFHLHSHFRSSLCSIMVNVQHHFLPGV